MGQLIWGRLGGKKGMQKWETAASICFLTHFPPFDPDAVMRSELN
jgi:hypothetical protein